MCVSPETVIPNEQIFKDSFGFIVNHVELSILIEVLHFLVPPLCCCSITLCTFR